VTSLLCESFCRKSASFYFNANISSISSSIYKHIFLNDEYAPDKSDKEETARIGLESRELRAFKVLIKFRFFLFSVSFFVKSQKANLRSLKASNAAVSVSHVCHSLLFFLFGCSFLSPFVFSSLCLFVYGLIVCERKEGEEGRRGRKEGRKERTKEGTLQGLNITTYVAVNSWFLKSYTISVWE